MKTMKRIHTGNFRLIIAGSRRRPAQNAAVNQSDFTDPSPFRKRRRLFPFAQNGQRMLALARQRPGLRRPPLLWDDTARKKAAEDAAVQNLAADSKSFQSPPSSKSSGVFALR
jgi:hypothetical protein